MLPCPGPDRQPRRPAFQVPPGACDTHAHVFGPASRYGFSDQRNYTPEDCTIEEYLSLLKALGFERGVIVQGGAHGRDNRVTLDAISRAPERLRGVAVIPAGTPPRELAALHAGGIRGARLSTVVSGGVGLEHFERLSKEVEPFGWHILLHFHRSHELSEVSGWLEQSSVPFVLDHIARITGDEGISSQAYRCLLRLLDGGNCWVKLASLYRLSSGSSPFRDMMTMIEDLVGRAPDRLLWGSNWPHPIYTGKMPNDGDLVDLIPAWLPDPGVRHRVLVENPCTLYGFEDSSLGRLREAVHE